MPTEATLQAKSPPMEQQTYFTNFFVSSVNVRCGPWMFFHYKTKLN
jgi:hypothetical protein